MSLHCRNCGWSQDDFWDENYNPITYLERIYREDLLYKDLDEVFELERETLVGDVYMSKITRREFIAEQLERAARKVRRMLYRTEKELDEKNPLHVCPNCGKKALNID